jgi:hypothetical protein
MILLTPTTTQAVTHIPKKSIFLNTPHRWLRRQSETIA